MQQTACCKFIACLATKARQEKRAVGRLLLEVRVSGRVVVALFIPGVQGSIGITTPMCRGRVSGSNTLGLSLVANFFWQNATVAFSLLFGN